MAPVGVVSVSSASTSSWNRYVPATVHEKVDYHVLAEVMPILECDLNGASDVCKKSGEYKKLRKMVVLPSG